MVFDRIENAHLYYGLGERFRRALEWLKNADPNSLETGVRVDIDGDNIYATYFDIDTLPAEEAKLEGHHDYADIQYLFEGKELVGYMPSGRAEPVSAYSPDIQFFQGGWDTLRLYPGNFYIVWPQDLHAPRLSDGEVSHVRRLVAKVKLT